MVYGSSRYAVVDLEKQVSEINLLKEKLQGHFHFEIPDYIIYDIYENEPYSHVFSIIGLAVVSNRMSRKNAETLKRGLSGMFINNQFNYEEWDKKYHNKEFIDLKNKLTDEDINVLGKLGIEIKDQLYTECEFDIVNMRLSRYYIDEEEMSEEEIETTKQLPKNVTKDEYNKLLDNFNKIFDSIKCNV